jgi:hypothetical protein
MDEQQQLNELKRKMVDTMSEMEFKASELQQKLNKKMELSKSNAEMGIKRVALEYRVEDLEIDLPYPPGYDPNLESDDDEDENPQHPRRHLQTPQYKEEQEQASRERLKVRLNEAQRVLKNMKLEALRQCREFQTTKLRELGEDGWTLQSVVKVDLPYHGVIDESDSLQMNESYTNLYYFSRPL